MTARVCTQSGGRNAVFEKCVSESKPDRGAMKCGPKAESATRRGTPIKSKGENITDSFDY